MSWKLSRTVLKTSRGGDAAAQFNIFQEGARRVNTYDSTRSSVENVAEALFAIARALERLGLAQASTEMGAIEALALQIKDLPGRLGASLEDAIRSLREDGVLEMNTTTVGEELKNVAEAIRGEKDPFD